ncbi:MAG: hypothetical protein GXO43_02210 [Crenarchaeota archaeon]|nr:hypothetical protein [Thermoproteota archaeon]
MRYQAKVGKMMKAVSGNDADAQNLTAMAAYNFAIGQGGYHVIRKNVSMFLDRNKVPRPARLPFYAMTQYVYRMITKEHIPRSELVNQKEEILSKYFEQGTRFYDLASTILDGMLGEGKLGGTV